MEVLLFCFGAALGSFLNVCIYRLPRKESIIRPGSHCPYCKHQISWYDNIPFLSYIILKGRCRHCKARIPFRYFMVELITVALLFFLYYHFGFGLFFWVYAGLCASLIVVSFIDIDIQEIPDEISLSGIIIGLLLSLIFPKLQNTSLAGVAFLHSFLGGLVGGGSIYITGLIGNAIFKKESMGGGDVKLMAMIGTFLGWKLVLFAFFLAPFFGSAVGIILKIKEGKSLIPYGPFLSLATFISIIWGRQIIAWLL